MKINRDNYREFFIDKIDNQLSLKHEEELKEFIAVNSDIEAEFDQSEIRLPIPEVYFPLKENIKKGGLNLEINAGNFEQFCIAKMEGDLSSGRINDLDKFLEENPECKQVAYLYNKLKLESDKRVELPDKSFLKKRGTSLKKVRMIFSKKIVYPIISVAATVAILVFAYPYIKYLSDFEEPFVEPLISNIQLMKEPVPISIPSETEFIMERDLQNDIDYIISDAVVNNSLLSEYLVEDNKIDLSVVAGISEREKDYLPPPKHRNFQRIKLETSMSNSMRNTLQSPGIFTEPIHEKNIETIQRGVIKRLVSLLPVKALDEQEKERLTLWNLAETGIKGINSLVGTDISLERKYDLEGELVSLAFSSRIIEFQKTSSVVED